MKLEFNLLIFGTWVNHEENRSFGYVGRVVLKSPVLNLDEKRGPILW